MPRSRTWLLAVLVPSTVVLLCLGLTELGLRALAPSARFFVYHPSTVRVFYPDEAGVPGVSGPSQFTTNSLGLRGPELGQERRRLLVMGGSTAACTALDDSEAWPEVVRRRVRERTGDPDFLWVANAGLDGKAARHHLMQAVYLLPELPRLDHVLVYAGLNDVGHWLYNAEMDPHELDKPAFWDDTVAESFRLSRYVARDARWFRKLELYRYASLARAALTTQLGGDFRRHDVIVQDDQLQWMKNAQVVRQGAQVSLVAEPKMDTLDAALDRYQRTLAATLVAIRKAGAEPIFMTQAIQWQNLDEDEKKRLWMGAMDGGAAYASEAQMEALVATFNERMLEVAAAAGVPALDLPAALAGKRRLYFDGCHFNEAGAREVGEVVTDFLLREVYGVATATAAGAGTTTATGTTGALGAGTTSTARP